MWIKSDQVIWIESYTHVDSYNRQAASSSCSVMDFVARRGRRRDDSTLLMAAMGGFPAGCA